MEKVKAIKVPDKQFIVAVFSDGRVTCKIKGKRGMKLGFSETGIVKIDISEGIVSLNEVE